MKLRVKILLATAALLTGLIASLSSLAFGLMRNQAEQEEVRAIGASLEQVLHRLDEQQKVFSATWNGWSQWDDAYRFVQDGNPEFIRSNLVAEEFPDLAVNFMAFLRINGSLTFATGYNELTNRRWPLPSRLVARWQQGNDLFSPESKAADRRWGFLASEA
ncbi:MAG: CHASE4 domain-containing protein, partial [Pseudanabaenaceae cyanobacterium]